MRATRKIAVAGAFVCLLAAVLTPTASAAPKPDWFVDEEALEFAPLPGAEAYWGVRSRAGYRIEVPENWNGDLVLYAHGYRGEGLELTVSNPPIRQYLIDNGFAWAASSYRANGYVPGTGAKDTHALIGEFTGRIANPDRVFITGHSMGGHVTGAAIEQWPNAFDGAVPMCGVMGDNELFDYFLDTYLLAEHFAGNTPEIPTPEDYYTSGSHIATFASLGLVTGTPTSAGQDYLDALEQLTGGTRPFYDPLSGGTGSAFFTFLFESAGTGEERGNIDTVYQLDNDPAVSPEEQALNDAIPRVDHHPRTRHPNGMGNFPGSNNNSPAINGTFGIPVVSLHTLGDLFVPFSMEQDYAERAIANGNEDLLVIRAIRGIDHCAFTVGEQEQAFADMLSWVDTGVRPAGDDVLDPSVVADPNFGCAFTELDRPGYPACP